MIKVSHESPLSMLELSRTYNDYDYALVHLFETHPEYYAFFEESLKMGRHVLLDNSIFELGTAFNTDKYISWIHRLNPTEFIIPDVLESCDGTLESASEFMQSFYSDSSEYIENDSKLIGVVQGKSYDELVKCYTKLDKSFSVDKIAISFDYSYYAEVFPHPNKWVAFMMGRVLTLTRLLNDGIINTNKPHHLLGCAHPREFSFYTSKEYNWIDTLDTSSPIVHGLKGVLYGDKIGTWEKEKTKLVDLLDSVPNEFQKGSIHRNLRDFRSYIS
jgi:hypothetical protein